ncbi:hypothetical protein AB1Y20_001003 [Prymnesium parvum]|uniref:Glycerophosphocholine acyltransferase 1 n=1 Tax=Prymnesium parvum TaxID=97485 RepID=A0AB34KAQ7_PRYPA
MISEPSSWPCCLSNRKPPSDGEATWDFGSVHCRRKFPIPLGSCLVAIAAVPIALVIFAYNGILYISQICSSIILLNHRKYYEYTARLRAECNVAGMLCHWFTKYYIISSILVILIVWPILIVLYPIVGLLHATFEMAKITYEESNMVEQSGTDEGFVHGTLDRMGLTDSETERLAERCAKQPCGMAIMWIGDVLLISGMAKGMRRIKKVLWMHRTVLKFADSTLDFIYWLESASILGVDIDVVPLQFFLKKSASATKAEAKKIKNADEEEQIENAPKREKQRKKKEQGKRCKPGNFFGLFSTIVALVFWSLSFFLAVHFL